MRKTKTEELKVVLLPARIHQALKLRAVKDRKTMKDIASRAIAKELNLKMR